MLLCQLPAKSHPAVTKYLPELAKSPYKPVRRLIQDNSPRFAGKLFQNRFPLFLISRKKSLESKTPRMQTRQSQCRNTGSRPRQRSHLDTRLITHGSKLLPRIRNTRSTCICDQCNICTWEHFFHENVTFVDLVILMITGHGSFYVKMI